MSDQYILDPGTGEMLVFADPYKNVTQEDVQIAYQAEQDILADHMTIEINMIKLAEKLLTFKNNQYYLARGFTSFNAWASSPQLKGIGKRTAHDLVRIAEQVLPLFAEREAMNVLPPISILYAMLPMLADENAEDKIIDAAYRVEGLTTADAKEVIKEIRGIPPKDTEVMFRASIVSMNETHVLFDMFAADEDDWYKINLMGRLAVKKKHWPRLEQIFRGYVEVNE